LTAVKSKGKTASIYFYQIRQFPPDEVDNFRFHSIKTMQNSVRSPAAHLNCPLVSGSEPVPR
jgi:hypothetical protein